MARLLLFDPRVPEDYPQLKMVNWFEWSKHEVEVDAVVHWRTSGTSPIAEAFAADLPEWFRHADQPQPCDPGS